MKEQVKKMVDRFLGWKLPKHFHPDAGISFKPEYNVEYMAKLGKPPSMHEPVGTNLFCADQAREMIEYISADLLAELATLRQQVEQLSAEVHHWKSNHDNRVVAARVLIERNDMPLERVQCYQDYLGLQRKVAELQASKARMAEELKLLILQDFDSEDAPDCPEGASEIVLWVIQQYQSRIKDIVFDTYDLAWLEADRAEARRKALEEAADVVEMHSEESSCKRASEKLRKLANEG